MSKYIEEMRKHLCSVNREIDHIQEYIKKIDSKRNETFRKGDSRRAVELLEVQKMAGIPERSGGRRPGSGRPPKKKEE